MFRFYFAILMLLMLTANAVSREQPAKADSVQNILDQSIKKARMALDRYGQSDSAMMAIQYILEDLASIPNIQARAKMKPLHGSNNMSRGLLATEGDSGICLYVSWFGKGAGTPVHNHLTWRVIRVLQGRDLHTRWIDAIDSADSVPRVAKQEERTLDPGESTYWLGPPNDIHSQQAIDDEVWELVMVGRDLSSDYVTKNQKRFDPKTGRPVNEHSK